MKDLMINGKNIGEKLDAKLNPKEVVDKGSIIIVMATDIPLSSRQIRRICKRASVGIARVGSHFGHGSGEIVIGFSTANTLSSKDDKEILTIKIINENKIDVIFRAMIEATEESILNSMITASEIIGYNGDKKHSLREFI